jgi:bacteriorhodopsin
MAVISIVGLVSGVIMVIGATMLRAHPQEHVMWGTVIIIFSAISFVGMGGFFIGALLGIIGGAFAISYRPRAAT